MNTTLFLFSIGPVKTFIEHSRKARDLYAGSYLLSYLVKAVIAEINALDDKRLEIIFPLDDQSNVPNRFIAKVNHYTQTEQEQLGQHLSQFVKDRFASLCTKVFAKSKVSPNTLATKQLQNFLEVYWVFEQQSTYKHAYENINAGLNNIKRLRSFEQMNEPSGRKCDIYPEYNAIFVRCRPNGMLPTFIDEQNVIDVSLVKSCKYAIKPGEGLSAIAFVKRMLHLLEDCDDNEHKLLPDYQLTISSVAYMLLKNYLHSENHKDLALLKDEASEALFDLQNKQKLSTEEYRPESIELAQKMYRELHLDSFKASPYYALLKFDGDGMGQVYRDHCHEQTHRQLSKATSDFSNQVKQIISEQGGICIYAGGEDFLGFLPVNKLFTTLFELRQQFIANVKAPSEQGKRLTFSAGIVIAHLMQPLGAMLAKMGEMEKQAKDLYTEKNAFSIGLVKRSGDQLVVKTSFGDDGNILSLMDEIIGALSRKQYAKSFLYNLSQTLARLGEVDTLSDRESIVKVLIEQALQKSTSSITKQEYVTQSTTMYDLFSYFDSNIDRFQSFLQFAAFVSREVK